MRPGRHMHGKEANGNGGWSALINIYLPAHYTPLDLYLSTTSRIITVMPTHSTGQVSHITSCTSIDIALFACSYFLTIKLPAALSLCLIHAHEASPTLDQCALRLLSGVMVRLFSSHDRSSPVPSWPRQRSLPRSRPFQSTWGVFRVYEGRRTVHQ